MEVGRGVLENPLSPARKGLFFCVEKGPDFPIVFKGKIDRLDTFHKKLLVLVSLFPVSLEYLHPLEVIVLINDLLYFRHQPASPFPLLVPCSLFRYSFPAPFPLLFSRSFFSYSFPTGLFGLFRWPIVSRKKNLQKKDFFCRIKPLQIDFFCNARANLIVHASENLPCQYQGEKRKWLYDQSRFLGFRRHPLPDRRRGKTPRRPAVGPCPEAFLRLPLYRPVQNVLGYARLPRSTGSPGSTRTRTEGSCSPGFPWPSY